MRGHEHKTSLFIPIIVIASVPSDATIPYTGKGETPVVFVGPLGS